MASRWARARVPLVLYGVSRGAEHSLLVASLLGDTALFAGVAVHAASDTVVASFDPELEEPVVSPDGFAAAWTWREEPLFGERTLPFGSGPRIRVERYPGPLFLSHGEDDSLWPSSRSRAVENARRGNSNLYTEAHYWPDEGHVIRSAATRAAFTRALLRFGREHVAAQ